MAGQWCISGGSYAGLASAHVGDFDFRYEQQYKTAWCVRKDLEESLMQPGNEAWEYFMLGAMLGVDSIHLMRRKSTSALEAMRP